MDPRHYARYPFLKDAAEYVKERGVTPEELITEEAFRPARTRGRQRVLDALNKSEIGSGTTATEADVLDEILSYPMARIFVSCINDKFLTRRYALAEGVTMNWRLEQEEMEIVEEIAYQLGVDATLEEESLRMHFADYLRFSSRLRSKDWKLVNTEVKKGYVFLNQTKFARLLQQALQDRIESELPLDLPDWIPGALSNDLKDLKALVDFRREQYKAEDFGKVSVENFPPCMQHLIGMTQAGENMPHSGRFALTAFLHHIGLSPDDILLLFATSPDFDASKTRYQVEHITGETSGTEYTPPECATMRSYGICYEPDKLCNHPKIKHPLTYYRIKQSPRRQAPQAEKPPE